MIAANYSSVREEFKQYCDRATHDAETIIITRKGGENVVMMSEEVYNNLMENLYIRNNKADYDCLMESIAQLHNGKSSTRNLSDE